MRTWTLIELEQAVRRAWGDDTCDPADLTDRLADTPSRGQCGVTALVLHDLLGGDLVLGEVWVKGERTGWHYWNRLPGGLDLDLTLEQFSPGELVVGGKVVQRPDGPPGRCREQYDLLRRRGFTSLDLDPSPAAVESDRERVRR